MKLSKISDTKWLLHKDNQSLIISDSELLAIARAVVDLDQSSRPADLSSFPVADIVFV